MTSRWSAAAIMRLKPKRQAFLVHRNGVLGDQAESNEALSRPLVLRRQPALIEPNEVLWTILRGGLRDFREDSDASAKPLRKFMKDA